MDTMKKALSACGITGERVRRLRAAAKERGRAVEAWCGSVPFLTVYPNGKLRLSGRGLGDAAVPATSPAPAPKVTPATAPAAKPVAGWWPFGKKKPKRVNPMSKTVMYEPTKGGGYVSRLGRAKRKRRRR